MLSVTRDGFGCVTHGSGLSVFRAGGRVALRGRLPDDLPVLACHAVFDRGVGVALAGGLCAAELLCAVTVAGATRDGPAPEAAEPAKKARRDSSLQIFEERLVSAGNRGGVNSILLVPTGQPEECTLQLAAFLGYQNGDVVRISLLVGRDKIVLVGSEQLLWSHRMDVRWIARHEDHLCSCSDDGCLIFGSLSAKSSREPVQLCTDAELLSCVFHGPNLIYVSARNHSIYAVDCNLAARKQKDMTWTRLDVPRLARSVGVSPDGAVAFGTNEKESFVFHPEDKSWRPVQLNLSDVASAFSSISASAVSL